MKEGVFFLRQVTYMKEGVFFTPSNIYEGWGVFLRQVTYMKEGVFFYAK